METLRQDIRYAVRMLWRTRGLTVVVLATVALCVGANTALFAVVHAALLRPLPYPDADGIVVADDQAPGLFLDWRNEATSFAAMAAFRSLNAAVTGLDRPERLEGAVVTASFFDVMRVAPALGRTLTPEDDRTGSAGGGARRRLLAAPLRCGSTGRRPIGHARRRALHDRRRHAAGFHGADRCAGLGSAAPRRSRTPAPTDGRRHAEPRLALPRRMRTIEAGRDHRVGDGGAARHLRAGAAAELRPPLRPEDVDVRLLTWREFLLGDDVRPALLVLLAAVGFVLLVGCANIANLMMARSSARQQEITVRAALGAGRMRLVRQLITESVVLSTLGGALAC